MFSLFAKIQLGFTPQDIGFFLMFIGLIGVIWQGAVIRPLVRKIGDLAAMRIALIAMIVGLLGLVLARTIPMLGLCAIVFSFGTGITRPTLSSLIIQAAPPSRKGGAIGVASSIESFSRSLAPILGGWIIGGLHPNYIGYVGAAMAAIGAFLAFRVKFDSSELSPVNI
jgi:DHA1 family tetracycline resistance protein-like MFS transporter